jgi:D-cysteine desulfhydrase
VLESVALLRHFPRLVDRTPWVMLGTWPTPVEPLPELARAFGCDPIWVKREDLSSPRFGGNKVRTLEGLFGQARAAGATRLWTTGAYGSNHAVAMALHGPLAGMATGSLLFPQPPTRTAALNLLALLATDCEVRDLPHAAALPLGMLALRRADPRPFVMLPGGATPRGALGAVSAGLELAEQIEAGLCPAPRTIVLAVGSTCTTAGLLCGLRLAARLGLAFGPGRAPVPHIVAVRVTPWPITSTPTIAALARATSALLTQRIGAVGRFAYAELGAGVTVERRYFAGGYGKPLPAGGEVGRRFSAAGGPPVDQVYTEKSAACLIERARRRAPGPTLFWATRSSVAPPPAPAAAVAAAPPAMRRWLRHCATMTIAR